VVALATSCGGVVRQRADDRDPSTVGAQADTGGGTGADLMSAAGGNPNPNAVDPDQHQPGQPPSVVRDAGSAVPDASSGGATAVEAGVKSVPHCEDLADCPEHGWVCVPDADCPLPLVCAPDFSCRSRCASDSDCFSDEICMPSTGRCVGAGAYPPIDAGPCIPDAPCSPLVICRVGHVVCRPQGPACMMDGPSPNGTSCGGPGVVCQDGQCG